MEKCWTNNVFGAALWREESSIGCISCLLADVVVEFVQEVRQCRMVVQPTLNKQFFPVYLLNNYPKQNTWNC
jgi:hypothetical protein